MTRLDALVRNLALVAQRTRSYVDEPMATNLVPFLHQDDRGWLPGSWRDSRVGYGNGRFAMDVNVVWVPKALAALEQIVDHLRVLDLSVEDVVSRLADGAELQTYVRDATTLGNAIETWRGARRHFGVRLDPATMHAHVETWLATLSEQERAYWQARVRDEGDVSRPLSFLALALDSVGQPIPAPNTDVATDLFLTNYTEEIVAGRIDSDAVVRMLDAFVRPYPFGLFLGGVGPVVVNDVYASSEVQEQFRGDLYHSPSVVWGREVNLLFLGLARQIGAAYDASGRLRSDRESFRSYVETLRATLETARQAVEESGLRHNELWSYRIEDGTLRPVRYGTSSDIQLWNLTDLAVRFLLDGLPAR